MSTATARSAPDSTHRASRYAVSVISSGSEALHLHNLGRGANDEFHLERPGDDEVERLFEELLRTRDLGVMPALPLEQKWHLVRSDAQLRWQEERSRRKQASSASAAEEGSPAWYIRKFLDKTVTPQQASALYICLRSNAFEWFRLFVELRGTPVLAQTLAHISKKGSARYDSDNALEYQVVQCIKQIFNYSVITSPSLILCYII